MAFKPGESGNPNGTIREKEFRKALNRAIAQDNGERLRQAAEKLLDLAAEGEAWAVNALADRLDGKPTQQVDMSVTDQRADELDDNSLLHIAAAGRDRTAQAKSSKKIAPELH